MNTIEVLAIKKRKSKEYCRFYTELPEDISQMILCNGFGLWPSCAFYNQCLIKQKKRSKEVKNLLARTT